LFFLCTKQTWLRLTLASSCISKISRRCAALATWTRHRAAALMGLNLRIRVVFACQTSIAPQLTLPYMPNASAVILRKVLSTVTSREAMTSGQSPMLW
jgi:hypothetical protein